MLLVEDRARVPGTAIAVVVEASGVTCVGALWHTNTKERRLIRPKVVPNVVQVAAVRSLLIDGTSSRSPARCPGTEPLRCVHSARQGESVSVVIQIRLHTRRRGAFVIPDARGFRRIQSNTTIAIERAEGPAVGTIAAAANAITARSNFGTKSLTASCRRAIPADRSPALSSPEALEPSGAPCRG